MAVTRGPAPSAADEELPPHGVLLRIIAAALSALALIPWAVSAAG